MMSHVRHAAATFLKKTGLGCASTWVFILVLALGLAANLPGDCNWSPRGGLECHHGWPATYLSRWRGADTFSREDQHKRWYSRGTTMSLWAVTRDVEEVKPAAALTNLVVVVLMSAAAGKATAWRLRRRQWCQLSLVELLLVTTLAALLFGYGAHLKRLAHEQRQILHNLDTTGAMVVDSEPAGPDWVLALLANRGLHGQYAPSLALETPWDAYVPRKNVEVDLMLCIFEPHTSQTIDSLVQLQDVRTLSLQYSLLTESHLRDICGLSELEYLSLSCSGFPNGSLRSLSSLRKLRSLHLDGSSAQDEDLCALECLSELVFLDLTNTTISDQCVQYLERLPRLERVNISGTHITEAGATRLWESGVSEVYALRGFRLADGHRGKFAVVVDPRAGDEHDIEDEPLEFHVEDSGLCVLSASEVSREQWPRWTCDWDGFFIPHHADVTPQPGRPMLFELPKRVDRGVVIHEYFVGTPEEWQNRPKVSPVDQRVAETVDRIVRTPEHWPVERLGPNQRPEAPKQGQAD